MKNIIALLCLWASLLTLTATTAHTEVTSTVPAMSKEIQAGNQEMVQAGVEEQETLQMTQAMVQAGMQEENIREAQHVIMEAVQRGLPAGPVMNKAFEGIAKQVPGPSIVRAMENVALRHENALSLAQKLSSAQKEVNTYQRALAASLASGVQVQQMEHLVNQIQAKASSMKPAERQELTFECLLTVRDMARRGVSSTTATSVITRAMEKGLQAQELRAMRHSFEVQSQQKSGEVLAKGYSNSLQAGMSSQNAFGQNADTSGSNERGGDGTGDGSGSGDGSGGSGGSGGGDGSGGSGGGDGSGDGSGGSGGGDGSGSGSGGGGGSGGSGSGSGR